MDNNKIDLLLSNNERKKNELEVKLILKRARANKNIINHRNQIRDNLYNKFLLREKRLKEAKINSEIKILRKIDLIRRRQMSRDIKDIEKKYISLNPLDINKELGKDAYKNKNLYSGSINYYSSNRVKYINEIKNKFYEKFNSLRGANDMIYEVSQLYDDFIINNKNINYFENDTNYNNNEDDLKLNNNINLPIINNRNYKGEKINTNVNNNYYENNTNEKEEEERKMKLQKILDSYKGV